jgi:hypothetical protein
MSFFVNLKHGAFFCHNCGAKGGDVLAFIRLRHGLDFKSAAQSLGAWHGDMTPQLQHELRRRRLEEERRCAVDDARRLAQHRMCMELREDIHRHQRSIDIASSLLCDCPDCNEFWDLLAVASECHRIADMAYCASAGVSCD